LQVTDPKFYHLDIFMRRLPGGETLINESAITPESFAALEKAVGADQMIDFKNPDPSMPVTNLTIVGSTLVMPYAANKDVSGRLEAKGYSIVTPDDVGIHAGFNAVASGAQSENAANHCMVLEMQDGVKPVMGAVPEAVVPRLQQPAR
jgi:N-dimethylarginine dimethylaminohydrolase